MNNTGALVYVVDDDVSVREAVGGLIRSAGWRADGFSSAQEFLASSRAEGPSCLVLDVELPGLSGLDLQQELAKKDVRTPIIFLTARGDIPMSVRAMKAGALEFLTKPINDEVLLDAIRMGIAHYQTPRQQGRGTSLSSAAIAQEFGVRMEERTRIARELHDTLLQSFHGLILRFQAAENLLPARPSEAKEALEKALDRADQALAEGRDAVHDLRSATVVTNDLAAAVATLGEELAGHDTTGAASRNSPVFLVDVEGTPQDLHPIPQDEIYRIAREALRNAFRHARARRIEVEIRYGVRELRVRIRDDGSGIAPSALRDGPAGHWGLTGMRERAGRIGGQMDLWSELGAGTEVELRVPASIAYQTYAGGRFRLFREWTGTNS
jgi:signal transduction histidine kinase